MVRIYIPGGRSIDTILIIFSTIQDDEQEKDREGESPAEGRRGRRRCQEEEDKIAKLIRSPNKKILRTK